MKILITGGASGLGNTITSNLCANADHKVYFTYCKSKESALNLEKQFPNATAIYADFHNESSILQLQKKIQEIDPDVLINNAVTGYTQNYFHKLDINTFTNSFSQNIIPAILITQEAIKIFRKKKFGKIITILSAGLINTPPVGWSEYTANKAYLHSLAKSWATENAAFNITSNCISPSLMQTNLTKDMDERLIEMAADSHPLKKLLTGSEVAESVNYLVKASQQVNGINLIINAASNVI